MKNKSTAKMNNVILATLSLLGALTCSQANAQTVAFKAEEAASKAEAPVKAETPEKSVPAKQEPRKGLKDRSADLKEIHQEYQTLADQKFTSAKKTAEEVLANPDTDRSFMVDVNRQTSLFRVTEGLSRNIPSDQLKELDSWSKDELELNPNEEAKLALIALRRKIKRVQAREDLSPSSNDGDKKLLNSRKLKEEPFAEIADLSEALVTLQSQTQEILSHFADCETEMDCKLVQYDQEGPKSADEVNELLALKAELPVSRIQRGIIEERLGAADAVIEKAIATRKAPKEKSPIETRDSLLSAYKTIKSVIEDSNR